jgi:hypothetical protein
VSLRQHFKPCGWVSRFFRPRLIGCGTRSVGANRLPRDSSPGPDSLQDASRRCWRERGGRTFETRKDVPKSACVSAHVGRALVRRLHAASLRLYRRTDIAFDRPLADVVIDYSRDADKKALRRWKILVDPDADVCDWLVAGQRFAPQDGKSSEHEQHAHCREPEVCLDPCAAAVVAASTPTP